MTFDPGTRLGRYEIRSLLGAGGMGEVYRARDAKLGRDVAVKVLPGDLAGNATALERFEREARAVAALSHPNILAIYDFGVSQEHAFAAMELLEGSTLRERLAEGPVSATKTARIGGQVASGLAAAHEKGIVHRDLKPENVFLTGDGQAKILDFGLVAERAAGPSAGNDTRTPTRTSLTTPGAVLGTVGYMSPEQVRGEPADHRSDIFSFGAVVYEMLSGRRAFERETAAETMTAILREEPAELPESLPEPVPPALLRVVRRCLEKRPEERFQSARDLAFAVESASQTSTVEGLPRTGGPVPAAPAVRRRGLGLAVATLAVGLAAGFGLRGLVRTEGAVDGEPARIRGLTVSGFDREPSASPDGRMVAFTSSRDGTPRIWIKQLSGGGEEPLTEGPDSTARFSPDGSSILFTRDEGDHLSIYRQALVGGQVRKLVEDATEAAWSPDGRLIGFTRMLTAEGRRTGEIRVADAQQGGDGELVFRAERSLYGLRWSPDGKALAAVEGSVTGNARDFRILLAPIGGGEPGHLDPGDIGLAMSAPVWLSDSSFVLAHAGSIIGDQGDPLGRVMLHDLARGTARTLFHVENLFPTQGLRIDFTEFDYLGPGRLVFHQTELRQQLQDVPLGGTGDRSAERALTRGQGRDRQPVFMPDGSRVLFTSNRSGNLDLWMADLATGALTQVTDDAAQDWDPGFTPDGRGIVWSSDRGGHLEIWTAAVDGSGARQVTRDGVDAENPTLGGDGEWVVYWSANPEKLGIWKIRLDGTEATRLVEGPFLQPDVSPDGRWAAFVTTETDLLSNVIRVVDVETGELAALTIQVPSPLRAPGIILGRVRWMDGGATLVYVGLDEHDRTGVFAQTFVPGRASTLETRRPLAGFSPDYITESFGIRPDGSRVVLSALRRSFRLALAEGLEGVRRER